jgi:hypothetical protein
MLTPPPKQLADGPTPVSPSARTPRNDDVDAPLFSKLKIEHKKLQEEHDALRVRTIRAESERDAAHARLKELGHPLPTRAPQRADTVVDAELTYLARCTSGDTLGAIARTLDADARAAAHQGADTRALSLRADAALAREILASPEGVLRASHLRAQWSRLGDGFSTRWDEHTRVEEHPGVPRVWR